MSRWPATKARLVLAALYRIGWSIKRQSGTSHRLLERPGQPDFLFAFHDREEISPRMLARIAKHTGLTPEDLRNFKSLKQRVATFPSIIETIPVGLTSKPHSNCFKSVGTL